MKKLIVSVKSIDRAFFDYKKALKKARSGRLKGEHYEISFDNKKDFARFVKNLDILSAIVSHRPKSIYELAKIANRDMSNLNKLMLFFESSGVIKIKETKVNGRVLRTPIVEYNYIEFDLKVA